MGFTNSKELVKYNGVYGYTGLVNHDMDLVEFFPITGPDRKRKIVDIFQLDFIKCPAEKKAVQTLFNKTHAKKESL